MPLSCLKSGVTRAKFSKFLHVVARLLQMNLLKLELQCSTPFWNAKAMIVDD